MSKGNDTVLVGVTVSLGLLLLVGAGVGGYMLVKNTASQPVYTPAVQPQQDSALVVGNGVMAPVGSGNAGWSAQQAADAERKREEEWRKADKISQLQRELADKRNEWKRVVDQLNVIENTPMPADIITRWSQQHLVDCKRSRFMGLGCDKYADLSDGYDKKAEADWDARKAELKRPLATQKSDLDARIIALVNNLEDLGVRVPRTT